ncbi:MAG: hypothetical protein A4E42_00388 [Methanoregulaceae archaeon PtaU1.Bin222]|nr:MAG: hypothetical protein A4E42_00388 [Methanoregulaceae archaeon PtaU1.Bin222]
MDPPAIYRSPDLVIQFGKLGFWFPSLLEIKICTAVEGFDDHFLAASSCEEDERDVPVLLADNPEKLDPVGIRHLVIRYDGIVGSGFKLCYRFIDRFCHINVEMTGLFEINPADIEKSWFIIDI